MKINSERVQICIVAIIYFLFLAALVFAGEEWIPMGGENNKYISQHRFMLSDICFVDINNGWIVGGGYGDERLILHSADGGRSWHRQSKEGKVAQFSYKHRAVHFADSQNGWIVGDEGVIFHTSNGGLTWLPQNNGIEPLNIRGVKMPIDLFDVHFAGNNSGWAVGGLGTIIHTENGGLTWERQSSGTTEILWGIHCADKNTCWAVGSRGTIVHTTNAGERWLGLFSSWKQQESGTGATLNGVHFIDKNNGWVVGNGGISHTSDGGKTWQTQARFSKTVLYKVFFVNKNKGWAVGADLGNHTGAIKYTEDGGKIWLSQPSGTNGLTSIYFLDENHGWIVGSGAILRYVGDNGTGK